MKKSFLVMFMILISFAIEIQSQGWNGLVNLYDPPVPSGGVVADERCALFSNKDGIHLLTARYAASAGYVYYYKLNTAGQVLAGPITLTSSQGNYPTITGDNNILYAVYHQGSNVKVHKSTNGGANWSSNIGFTQTANSCNGVDAEYTAQRGLHVVWSEKVGSVYESYFRRYYNNAWQNFSTITDVAPIQNGGMPTVAISNNKAHVSVNTGNGYDFSNNVGQLYSRDFNYTSWSSPIAITTNPLSRIDKIFVKDDIMHAFYYINTVDVALMYRRKTVSDGSWSSATIVDNDQVLPTIQTHKISISQTADDLIHVCYINGPNGFVTKSIHKNGGNFSNLESISGGGSSHFDHAIASTSNDMFFIYSQIDKYYQYRQYNALPLAPQNLTIGANPGNGLVRLQWAANNEPDLALFEVSRRIENCNCNWEVIGTTTNTYYVDADMLYLPIYGLVTSSYAIRAVDVQGLYSGYSNIVTERTEPLNKNSTTEKENIITEYNIQQNYPNPFNPVTTINYQLPQRGLVQLKIYDLLGNEIAVLVNEEKPEGIHEVEFNAANLPSGIYFYKLQAGKFSSVKKMMLMR